MKHDWRGRARYTVFDAAYGDGAAFRALLAAWHADPQRPARLHCIALCEHPLPGFRRILQDDSRVTLDLLCAPIDTALTQLDARIDAASLHGMRDAGTGFARALARLSVPGTVIACDGLTPEQGAALAREGFLFDAPGAARAVFATRKPSAPRHASVERRAIVVGAGVAGAAACERLCARGWAVVLVERHAHPAAEASGNLAGIYMPLVSKDDNIPTRLSRAAYLFALDYWERLGGLGQALEGAPCGVLQLARDAAHAQVQREVSALRRYPSAFAQWLESDAASALLGASAPHGGWLFPQAGWARPASACAAMLAACGARLEQHFGVGSVTAQQVDGAWRVAAADGRALAQAPLLILASGAASLAQTASLPLAAVRGQVSYLDAGTVPNLPLVLCRDSYLTPAAGGVHCAGATYDSDGEPALRRSSHDENLGKLRSLLGECAAAADPPMRGRVGFRCVAPDRLPLVGALPDERPSGRLERLRALPRQPGLYGLLGYASRGLTWAPLAAELLAAQLDGEPLPLETTLVRALDPARFMLRGRTTA